ncbi:MAG: 4-hydroxy-tetrahydrodipicolinate reductase [Deltaproteobacteria bacterium]|nr:MAG: 4-hydroxy-tetrahydrodipicolinate reductase [Deltaproteobacteria bacterium]
MLPIVIVGARGRMGTTLIRNVLESDDLALVGAVDRTGAPGVGQDAGILVGLPPVDVTVGDRINARPGTVVVDFSLPESTERTVERCVEGGLPLVLGTTGLAPATRSRIEEASTEIPIVYAANYSVGVTLLTRLSALAARALGTDWDAEIVELHHRFKRDAPSGTALRIARAVAEATGRGEDAIVTDRTGRSTPREPGEIGVAALRGGASVGEHTLMLLHPDERIELTHRAYDRSIFARGALRAARWVSGKAPGLYDMADVLGLSELA